MQHNHGPPKHASSILESFNQKEMAMQQVMDGKKEEDEYEMEPETNSSSDNDYEEHPSHML